MTASRRVTQHAGASGAPPGADRARRDFIGTMGSLVAAPALLFARRAGAAAHARRLSFEHTHTGERLALTYAIGDAYLPPALDLLRRFLRDFRNGEMHAIDPGLLDQLHQLAAVTATGAPFQVISAYRSPATNRQLRERSHGVAARSLHLTGQAIDIRLADVALGDLRDAAVSLRAGGVGFYPASDFVHVDTGRVRRW
jgi:uncharacterized protein YcbK (DUF882 family)